MSSPDNSFKLHNKLTPNVELFLQHLGVEYFWGSNDKPTPNSHVLVVTNYPAKTKRLVSKALAEVKKYGFIPYHYCLNTLRYKGTAHNQDDKIAFTGKVVKAIEFKNVNGNFYLIHIEDEENKKNYIWKRYKPEIDEIPTSECRFTGRLKAVVSGMKGEKLNLINYVRIKDVHTDSE